ncbi:hypothetical protein E2C01_051649 [Portunus trituberculatus]|uniref:Uncharacterized protein n=1 Tax=Portunus trituberculatus TaxID=210409 RepID=A0A5B7GMC8_PORTR|nr:hypothetical protein [Portunus trituberculatus]
MYTPNSKEKSRIRAAFEDERALLGAAAAAAAKVSAPCTSSTEAGPMHKAAHYTGNIPKHDSYLKILKNYQIVAHM